MKKNKRTHQMAKVLMLCFIAGFLLISGRFIYIQTTGQINNVSLKDWAKDKRMSTYDLKAERGKILDSNGMILSYDRPSYKLYAIVDETYTIKEDEPQHVVDEKDVAKKLSSILDVEEDYLLEKIVEAKENDRFQVEFGSVGKELNQQQKEEIEELELPGINFEKESIRYYPNDVFASHIIGFAKKNDEDNEDEDEVKQSIVGVTGIEKVKDDILRGEDGFVSYQRDRFNKKLLDPKEVVKKPVDGQDIYLTIDQKVQVLLEDVMSEAEEKYNPKKITATVMNAKTGEIIAMSNRPSFNPNNPVDVENWYNDSISTPFEPGSTVKMFTWAAAIDAGVYNGNEEFQSGRYKINERVSAVNDHNQGKGWGKISYDEGFARSSNVAASKLVWEKIGPDDFLDYLKAFDFDKETEIDLPGEVTGRILYEWPAEKLTTSFGQGSTVTPIQQLKAATAIANGGEMLKPYVIKRIIDTEEGKVVQENDREVVGNPISEETADKVLDLMSDVVTSDHGTGAAYNLNSYSVAGKTGTAQIPNPDGTTPYLTGKNNNVFSFLGMAPKDDPELIMYVAVTQPELADDEVGSDPVSFIFNKVMENSLHYLNVTPDKEDEEESYTAKVPKISSDVKTAKKELKEKGFNVTVVGKGEKLQNASVKEGDTVLLSERILLITDKPKMPDITGWSLRDVYQLAELLELKFEPIGNGFVVKQSIEKGKKLKKDDYLGVEFKPLSKDNASDEPEPEETEEQEAVSESEEAEEAEESSENDATPEENNEEEQEPAPESDGE